MSHRRCDKMITGLPRGSSRYTQRPWRLLQLVLLAGRPNNLPIIILKILAVRLALGNIP